jgi:polar amino acid transport system substrate-binding protein
MRHTNRGYFMKKHILAAWVVVLAFLASSGSVHGGNGLTIITEDYPPLNFVENNVLKGPAVDIVRAIKDRLKDVSKIKVYPWARGYHILENRRNTALF